MEEIDLEALLVEQDGFLFLKVPEKLICPFMELIGDRRIEHPSVANVPGYVGAHISVVTAEETSRIRKKSRKVIREIGSPFRFRVGKLCRTQPGNWLDVREVFFLTVHSPELEAFRRKYKLGRLLNGHDFHITVGVRRDGSKTRN